MRENDAFSRPACKGIDVPNSVMLDFMAKQNLARLYDLKAKVVDCHGGQVCVGGLTRI